GWSVRRGWLEGPRAASGSAPGGGGRSPGLVTRLALLAVPTLVRLVLGHGLSAADRRVGDLHELAQSEAQSAAHRSPPCCSCRGVPGTGCSGRIQPPRLGTYSRECCGS